MKKSRLSSLALILMTFSTLTWALETYVVKPGDHLSGILRRRYPKHEIYGPQGSLKLLLTLNPRIKNKNFVLPGQKIVLPDYDYSIAEAPISIEPSPVAETEAPVMSEAAKPIESELEAPMMSEETPAEVTPEAVEQPINWIERFWIAGFYGVRFNSVGQRGSLGDADIGEFNFINLQGMMGYSHQDLDVEAGWEQFNLHYKKAEKAANQSLHNFNLNVIYKDWIVNVGQNQIPIMYNDAGNITFTPQSQTMLGLGLRKEYLENLELRGLARVPVSQSLQDSNISSSGLKGYGLLGQVNFSHKIKENDKYQLDLLWNNQVSWQKSSQSIDDGVSSKSLDTTFTNASSYVGLKLKLK